MAQGSLSDIERRSDRANDGSSPRFCDRSGLANLFLHYVFDEWMSRNYPTIPFERYADDTICHCVSKKQAQFLKAVLMKRFEECGLKLNEEKTKSKSTCTKIYALITSDTSFKPR